MAKTISKKKQPAVDLKAKVTKVRLNGLRRQIAEELPELIDRERMRREARQEPTVSGELRRAIHASTLPLSEIASRSKIPLLALDEFLTGERTLRSDVIDRLAISVKLEFIASG
jgi:hypothetical protein